MKNFLRIKEPVNALTHFTIFVGAIAGLVFLISKSRYNISKLTIMTVYGVSIILMYGASTLYHWLRTTPRKVLVLKKIDHIAIYLFIAGTYTPVLYYGLQGLWKWSMLAAVWVLSITGIFLKLWFINLPRHLSTAFYITLGWIALVPFLQLIKGLPQGAIILMILGGVVYTVGGIIYTTKCLDFFPNRFGFHEIFHLFVIGGSVIHFIMVVNYLLPL
ncbi:MAG TPA: hemolysin III family protein [Bacillota bacterium]|jgi:hemolysin III|nr:hemolysin III family protein [Peptococcaceae bacterium MAG4]HPU35210.1 hemolysin III family protein [Bacillota bacterium]HPZ43495.1 hemolysin III family protein [Bacillota bacterium]HQD76014.1 hemolysin III family protein [Bacillota bacterium]HUM58668.1 hemolysin III family protein [Bacillota bacterium]